MKRKILSILAILVVVMSLGLSFVPVKADCPGNSVVRVLPGFNLNIRSGAGKEFALLGTLNFDDGEKKTVEIKNDYLRLDGKINGQDGWIWNRYLSVVCEFTPTVTLTSTSQASSTWTQTSIPTITNTREPTPTRITPIPNTIFVWINNVAFVCTNPCTLNIEIK